jgi:AAA+ superfamily predicted ATPase
MHLQNSLVEFILYGAIHDHQPVSQADGQRHYLPLPAYLSEVLFQPRETVIRYAPQHGLSFRTQAMRDRFLAVTRQFDQKYGTRFAAALPAAPEPAFALLEFFCRRELLAERGVGLIIEQADQLLPARTLDQDQHRLLNTLLRFAREPLYLNNDFACVLLAEAPDALHQALREDSYVYAIELPWPDEALRRQFLQDRLQQQPALAQLFQLSAAEIASQAVGLELRQLGELLEQAGRLGEPITEASLTQYKRSLQAQAAHSLLRNVASEGYPPWVEEFSRLHATRTIAQFVLHGNIVDYVPHQPAGGPRQYFKLKEYLLQVLFRDYDIVMTYDRAAGLGFRDKAMEEDFFVEYYFKHFFQRREAAYEDWLKKLKVTEYAFGAMERYMQERLAQGKRLALVVEYAETLAPMGSSSTASFQDRAILVYFLKWAQASQFASTDMTTVMLTSNLNELNQQLVRNPFTDQIELAYPEREERRAFIDHYLTQVPSLPDQLEMSPAVLARDTAGLNLVQLKTLLAEISENATRFTFKELTQRKKAIIETEGGGLLGFIETRYDLDAVAGHDTAKQHLRQAANALKQGREDVMPMGYLVSGPVGTGKTFLVSCFAAEIGIPMVALKNFRSQYVGLTEANLERVLRLLKAMSPVAVMIDEADAYLGHRAQGGDSGVSSRVFSMIASFMSNTDHRGRILWFLLTARPDLMPVDLKRQGRAEEHIALFYPETLAEKRELLTVMLKKTGITSVQADGFSEDFFEQLHIRSGADMEAALTRAKFRAAALGAERVDRSHIEAAFQDFLPPTYPEEVELMNYAAVLECTSRELLPEHYAHLSRATILQRMNALKSQVS